MDELESLKQQLEELRSLRNKLSVEETKQEVKVEENTDIRKTLKEEIDSINKEIEIYEEEVKKAAKEYEKSYKNLQKIIDDYEAKTESTKLLSEEEIKELRETTEDLKIQENERSIEIKRRLDAQKRIIRALKSKRTKLENNINKAEALGLTYEEYKEITSTIKKTSIMNSILEKKGLLSVIEKPYKERTKEEKNQLKEVKEEIIKEITEMKKQHADYSVLDTIEALYFLETSYTKVEEPKKTEVKKEDLINIANNIRKLATRVVTTNAISASYTPEAQPEDMTDAQENVKVDINELKPAEEKVTLFKDTETNEYYARKYAVSRFKLKSADFHNEVKINGSVCYKISDSDVAKIKENANNTFSPYIADIKEVTIEKEKSNDEVLSQLEEAKKNLLEAAKSNRTEEIEEAQLAYDKAYNELTSNNIEPPKEEKDEELSVDDITSIVKDELQKKDKPKPNNIKATENFKKELKSGGILYNIVSKLKDFKKKVSKAYDRFLFGKEMAEKIEMFEQQYAEDEPSAKAK